MSDSFADLWNSSAPPKSQPQKLGSVLTRNALKPVQPDVFSLLSSAGSSNHSSRSMSPVVAGGPSQRTTQNSVTTSLSNGGDDAFSSLLSGSLVTSTNGKTGMTMAEKAAEAERQKLGNLSGHEQIIKPAATSNVWDGLDSLAIASTKTVPSSSKHQQAVSIDDWAPDTLTSQTASFTGPAELASPHASIVMTQDNDWLNEFVNEPMSQLEPQTISDQFKSKLPSLQHATFDFGDRQDTFLGDDFNSEDDILGALSKPIDTLPKRRSLFVRLSLMRLFEWMTEYILVAKWFNLARKFDAN